MLKLMKLPTAWGIRNASAFNMQAEALLTMSGLPFETVEALPDKGPKGKLPALIDGDLTIGDLSLIQRHLETVHGVRFDEGLDARQLADAEAYRRMSEEWLYFIALYIRWIIHPEITKEAFFGSIPWPLRGLIFSKLRKTVQRTLNGQGIARHSQAEIVAFGIVATNALADRISSGPYFHGEGLHSIDAALYPQIVNILDAPYDTKLRDHAKSRSELLEYVARCDERIFGAKP